MSNKPPRILFIATREPSYSRVDIVLHALKSRFEVIPLVSSARSYWARFLKILWDLLGVSRHRYDLIFVGFFAQPIFPLVRLLSRKPIISDVYFSIYDTFIEDKQLASRSHVLARLCRWLDLYIVHNSALLFTDTNGNARYLSELARAPAGTIKRLWISAQPQVFYPLPALAAAATASFFRVLFYGGFIPLQGVEVIIRAASLLKHPSLQFDIVGTGQTFAACERLNTELKNDHIVFHGWRSQGEICQLAKNAHLILGIFGSSNKASRVIPNKVYEGLAMAKPVLTGDSPAIRELLTPGRDVITCTMSNPQSLARAIDWSRTNYDQALQIGQNGHDTFIRHASPDVIADILEQSITLAFLDVPTSCVRS
jgi:glycosyltransferase involved in cell wall biosynthesis